MMSAQAQARKSQIEDIQEIKQSLRMITQLCRQFATKKEESDSDSHREEEDAEKRRQLEEVIAELVHRINTVQSDLDDISRDLENLLDYF